MNPRPYEVSTDGRLRRHAGELRHLAVEEHDFVLRVEREDEHVRQVDDRAVSPLELLSLALEAYLRERLTDRGHELLGPEALEDHRERARAERGDGRLHAREARDENDLAVRARLAERPNQVDAAAVGELDVDQRDVEAVRLRALERSRAALGDEHVDGFVLRTVGHRRQEYVSQGPREVGVVVDDEDAAHDAISFSMSSFTSFGLALPLVSFMTCPTR